MTHTDRRKARAVVAAAPAAVAVGLPFIDEAGPGDTKLLELIQLYRTHQDALAKDCRRRDVEDEELDARIDQGCGSPRPDHRPPRFDRVGALAALNLALEGEDSRYLVSDFHEEALFRMVHDYLAEGN
jgi:hypothetical protein